MVPQGPECDGQMHHIPDEKGYEKSTDNLFLQGEVCVEVFTGCGENKAVHKTQEGTDVSQLDDRDNCGRGKCFGYWNTLGPRCLRIMCSEGIDTCSQETDCSQEGLIRREQEVVEIWNGRRRWHRCIREEVTERRVDKEVGREEETEKSNERDEQQASPR